MINLFWTNKNNKTINLVSNPFSSEEEFEKVVFDTKELFEDIHLLKRQVRGGKKSGIPDILGIDSEGNVCIIEMKNISIDFGVMTQVLEYAYWAQQNPDSIKNLWFQALQSKSPPEISEPDWNNYEIKIIIIAPSIDQSTSSLVNTINYPVDLIEVKRWQYKKDSFLMVQRFDKILNKKTTTTRGLEEYDYEFYENHYNKISVKYFFQYVKQLENFVKSKKWPLDVKFNKNTCAFKNGFFRVFYLAWEGTKTFSLKINLPKDLVNKHKSKADYYVPDKGVAFLIKDNKTKINKFFPLLVKSYEHITGLK